MKWSLEQKTSAGFGLALAMALVLGVISYLDTRHLIESTRGVADTQGVLKEIQSVVSGYRDAEAQAHGYVLTGNELYLVRFGDASAWTRAHAQQVAALTAANPRQQERVRQLNRSVEARLAALGELIHARKDKGLEAAQELDSSPSAQKEAQKEVDEFRGIVGGLQDEENLLLNQRVAEAETRDRRTILALALLILVAVPYLIFSYIFILRDLMRRRLTEKDLAEKTTYLNALIENSPLGIVVLDSERQVRLCNPAFLSLFQSQLAEVSGAPLEILIGTTDEASELVRRLNSGEILEVTRKLRRKDGTEIDVEIHAVSLRVAGHAVGTLGLCQEITERRRAQAALQEANDRLALLLHETEQRALESSQLSQLGELLLSCQTAEEAYDIVAKVMLTLFPAQSGALCVINSSRNLVEVVAVWGAGLATERAFTPDDCWALRRGRVHTMGDSSSAPRCAHMQAAVSSFTVCIPMVAQGETVGVLHLEDNAVVPGKEASSGPPLPDRVRLATTIAEQVSLSLANLRLREALRNQSIRDPLTGLFNRRYLDDSLQREVRRATRKNRPLSILMLDLDHFKRFNDTFGHEAGDTLLRHFGSFLQSYVRADDLAFRYGGEEFVIILPEATLESARQRAEQLVIDFKRLDVQYRGMTLGPLTVSVGLAAFPEQGTTAEAVLRAADQALYRAKADGRDRVVV